MGVSLYMMTGFAIDQPSRPVIVSGVVQGLGLGLIFVPLQTLAFETLAPRMRTTGAALLNLSRNIGGSVGISIVSTQLVRMTQVSHADLAAQITQQNIPTADPTILQTAVPVAGPAALAYINMMINKQALFIAYLDDFKLMMIITFAILPLLFFMKRGNKVGGGGPPVHMD
jgi:DHA2 family multidrug resistance protein